jgi:hypothetical protein
LSTAHDLVHATRLSVSGREKRFEFRVVERKEMPTLARGFGRREGARIVLCEVVEIVPVDVVLFNEHRSNAYLGEVGREVCGRRRRPKLIDEVTLLERLVR